MATIRNFQDLRAWQQCRSVRRLISKAVKTWPADERFRLVDQIIRSSRSSTSNIAEGYGRFHERDNVRLCRMAIGSVYETPDHLLTALDEGWMRDEEVKALMVQIEEAIITLNGYMRYLLRHVNNVSGQVSEPKENYGVLSGDEDTGPNADHPLLADL